MAESLNSGPADDYSLVSAAAAGDHLAFSALYRRHQPLVARRLLRILGRGEDVEDVMQTTFLTAHKILQRFRPDAQFAPWISGIAVRCAANFLRSKRRRFWLRLFSSHEEAHVLDVSAVTAEQQVIDRQLAQALFQIMERLPPNKRIAFSLHTLEGLGFTEIGAMVDASPQTVRARVLSARTFVEEELKTLYGDAAVPAISTGRQS